MTDELVDDSPLELLIHSSSVPLTFKLTEKERFETKLCIPTNC